MLYAYLPKCCILNYQFCCTFIYQFQHYNFRISEFDNIERSDWDPDFIIADKINSNSNRFSIRLNLQGLLKNNEYASIAIGLEITYNYLWGKDLVEERIGQSLNPINYTRSNDLTKEIGLGLILKIEIKKIIIPQLSLCFTTRSEFISDGVFAKGGVLYFLESLDLQNFNLG